MVKVWGICHLWHCVRAADIFPEDQIVNALSTQLSWTHICELAGISDELKRTFYTELSVREKWSIRILLERIGSMLYERTALSKKPEEHIRKELDLLKAEGAVTPDLIFRSFNLHSVFIVAITSSFRTFISKYNVSLSASIGLQMR